LCSLEAGVRGALREAGDATECGELIRVWLGRYVEYLKAVGGLL
jgi:hypothetical protein